MYLADRFVEASLEKFGMFGVIGIVGGVVVVLLVGTIIGAGLNSRFNSKHPDRADNDS